LGLQICWYSGDFVKDGPHIGVSVLVHLVHMQRHIGMWYQFVNYIAWTFA